MADREISSATKCTLNWRQAQHVCVCVCVRVRASKIFQRGLRTRAHESDRYDKREFAATEADEITWPPYVACSRNCIMEMHAEQKRRRMNAFEQRTQRRRGQNKLLRSDKFAAFCSKFPVRRIRFKSSHCLRCGGAAISIA